MVSTRLSKESPVLLSVRECLWQKLGLSWIASFSRKKSGLGVGGDKRNQEESCGPPAETGEEKPLRFQRNAWEALSHVDKSHTDTLINHTLLLVWGEVPHFCAPLVKIPLLLCYSSVGTVVRGVGVGCVLLGVGISENSSDVLGLGKHGLTSGSHLDGASFRPEQIPCTPWGLPWASDLSACPSLYSYRPSFLRDTCHHWHRII